MNGNAPSDTPPTATPPGSGPAPTQSVTAADLIAGEAPPAPAAAAPPAAGPPAAGPPSSTALLEGLAKPPKPAPRGKGRPKDSKTRRVTPGSRQDTAERRAKREAEAMAAAITAPTEAVPDFSDLAPAPAEAPPDYDLLAAMVFDTSTGALTLLLGPEWQPQNEQERTQMVGALKRYLEAKQVKDIPPGYLLALVVLIYSAPRFHQPETKKRLILFTAWFKAKLWQPIKSFFARRRALPPAP